MHNGENMLDLRKKDLKNEIRFQIEELKEIEVLFREGALGEFQFSEEGKRRAKKVVALLEKLKNRDLWGLPIF